MGHPKKSGFRSWSKPTFIIHNIIITKSCKRKRENLLEELINQSKIHQKEKNTREEKKLEMFDKFREERLKMHEEKISMQQKLLDIMTKLCSANKNN